MMIIYLGPQYSDSSLLVSRQGDVLTINGEEFDFSPVSEGATLPWEALNSDYFRGSVERIDGKLHIRLILPIQRAVFHDSIPPIIDPPDGPIDLPVIKEIEHVD